MPRMAQPGTTTNLRRLAGRRAPTSGGPHIPLDSNELPPVLFRLPEVATGSPPAPAETSSAAPTPTVPPNAVAKTTFAPVAPATHSNNVDSEDAGQNVFNHVAGAVTGAVAGTVANSVAVAGTLAGSALAVTPFATSTSTTRSFSSAAASLSPLPALEPAAKPRPVVRPIPESAEADSRSWWEHWSSGIILMLLILALVTAGIMAIRDPERSRATNRPIADDAAVETALPPSPISSNNENVTNNKPALANTPVTSATPAASASLSPSLLPDPSTSNNNSTSSRVPSFTLNPNPNAAGQNHGANASTSNPAMLADKSGFVSSNTPSPGAAASQGSAFPNASRFAAGNSSGTPAISASTQLGPSGSGEFEATVPATENNSNTPAPSLTWPVEQDPATDAARSQHQSSVPTPNPNELTLLDEGPDTELRLPATSDSASSTETQATPSTTDTLAAPATSAPAVTVSPTAPSQTISPAEPLRAAYRETALPNEDLESILAMRRQAMSNARMVSNQYFADPNAQAAAMPVANAMAPNQAMPSHYNPNQAMPMQGQQPQAQQYQGQQPQAQQYQSQSQPMQQQPQGQINPNTGYPWQNQPSPNQGAPLNGVNYNQPTAGNSSQGIGTRSWTYNPNTNSGSNSWTLPASGVAPTAANQPPPNQPITAGGYQIDPNYARQLGYGQNSSAAPAVNQTNSNGWNNQAAGNRVPTNSMQSNVPNIMAPAGSMVAPNQGGAMPNTQPFYPNNNVPQGYPAGYQR